MDTDSVQIGCCWGTVISRFRFTYRYQTKRMNKLGDAGIFGKRGSLFACILLIQALIQPKKFTQMIRYQVNKKVC